MINEEISLTEAVKFQLPDEGDTQILEGLRSPTDPQWDELYSKYLYGEARGTSNPEEKYVVITASHLVNKTNNSPKSGYVQYDSDTSTEYRRGGGVDILSEPSKLKLVTNRNDATVYTEQEAESIIRAIKKSKDFRLINNHFKTEQVRKPATAVSSNPLEVILCRFFDVLTHDDNAHASLTSLLSYLISECNRRKNSQLCNNLVLKFLGNAYKLKSKLSTFPVTPNWITKLVNVIVNGNIKQQSVEYGGDFKGTVIYNKLLYALSEKDIIRLCNAYSTLASLTPLNSTLKTTEARNRFAKNVILQIEDDSIIDTILNTPIDTFNKESIKFDNLADVTDVVCNLNDDKFTNEDSLALSKPLRDLNKVEAIIERLKQILEIKDEEEEVASEENYNLIIKKDGIEKVISNAELKDKRITFRSSDKTKLILSNGVVIQLLKGKDENILAEGDATTLPTDGTQIKFTKNTSAIAGKTSYEVSGLDADKEIECNLEFTIGIFKVSDEVDKVERITKVKVLDVKDVTKTSTEGESEEETREEPSEETSTEDVAKVEVEGDSVELKTSEGDVVRKMSMEELADALNRLTPEEAKQISKNLGSALYRIRNASTETSEVEPESTPSTEK